MIEKSASVYVTKDKTVAFIKTQNESTEGFRIIETEHLRVDDPFQNALALGEAIFDRLSRTQENIVHPVKDYKKLSKLFWESLGCRTEKDQKSTYINCNIKISDGTHTITPFVPSKRPGWSAIHEDEVVVPKDCEPAELGKAVLDLMTKYL